jgi:ATP-binding cassette subfamily B protein
VEKAKSTTQSTASVRHLLRYLKPYIRPHRPLIAGSFAAMFAGVLMRALEPWPLKIVIDQVIVPVSSRPGESNFLASLQPMEIVAACSVTIVLIMVGRAACTYCQKVGFALVGNRVMTNVRAALYRHIQCLSLSFHNKARSGDLIVRVIGDIGMLKDVAVTALMPLIGSLMILALMSGLMLWMNWQLALLVLVLAPLYWLPTHLLSRNIKSVSREQRKREGAVASTTAESLGAMQVIKTLSLENTFADQFGKHNQKSLKDGVKMRRLLARLQGSVQIMTGVSTALVLFYGTTLVLKGALSAGELLVFLSYLKAIFKPTQDFAKYSGRIAKASSAGERVIQIFETPADVVDAKDAKPAPPFEGEVSFDSVSYGYDSEQPILKNISFHIKPGQTVAIVGHSGAGKSTLIGLLSRLYDPTSGQIRIDGTDIRQLTLESVRLQTSVVLQDTLLFTGSIADNIGYGAPGSSSEAIRKAARLANIDQFIMGLPSGYDTQVGERGVNLSMGQRQRVSLARAALRQAPLLILDEPTSSLDEENRQAIMDAIKTISADCTTFMITHDLRQIASADVILHLKDGELIETGTHEELLHSGGAYAKLIDQGVSQNASAA